MKIDVHGAWLQSRRLPADEAHAFRIIRNEKRIVGVIALACEAAFDIPAFRPISGVVLDTIEAAVQAAVDDYEAAVLAGFEDVHEALRRTRVSSDEFGLASPAAGAIVGTLENGCFRAAWIGSNQAILSRESTIKARTIRHNVGDSVQMSVNVNALPANLHQVWTRTISGSAEFQPPDQLETAWPLRPGDRIAMLSGNLADKLSDEQILAVFRANHDSHEISHALAWEAVGDEKVFGLAAIVFVCDADDA